MTGTSRITSYNVCYTKLLRCTVYLAYPPAGNVLTTTLERSAPVGLRKTVFRISVLAEIPLTGGITHVFSEIRHHLDRSCFCAGGHVIRLG